MGLVREIERKIFRVWCRSVVTGLRLNRANRISCGLAEEFSPIYEVADAPHGRKYSFYCPNSLTRWRAESFFTKEPETLEWIDGFSKNDILFDVGANIGLYSIYAAAKGHTVLAFEPESQNYSLINRNVFINGLAHRISCFNVAVSDRDSVDSLHLSQFLPGGSFNQFGEESSSPSGGTAQFSQGSLSFSLDSFVKKVPDRFPTHLKIDVDGLEPKIIDGAKGTLGDPRLKSILIEVDEQQPSNVGLIKRIEAFGFTLAIKEKSPLFTSGPMSQTYNCIFRR